MHRELISKIIKRLKRILKWKHILLFLDNQKPYSNVFGLDKCTPIDRLYIEHFLNINKEYITGSILEVAESTYSHKFGRNVTNFQILHYDTSNDIATITGDLSAPESLPSGVCDCFICTQTLNFIFDVQSAIKGSYKLLSPGGIFLGTVAGLSQISRYDMDRWGDYWRFTDLSVKLMFEKVFGENMVETVVFGNALAATAFIQGIPVEEILNKNKLMEIDDNYQLIIGIKAIKRNE